MYRIHDSEHADGGESAYRGDTISASEAPLVTTRTTVSSRNITSLKLASPRHPKARNLMI